MMICCREDASKDLPEDGYDQLTLNLVDSFGRVHLRLPNIFDTNYTWVHQSDCGKPCDEQKYRFQSKSDPIVKETGWYWKDDKLDSITSFTVSHSLFKYSRDKKDTVINNHDFYKERTKLTATYPPLVFDTLQKVDGKYFSIFIMRDSIEQQSIMLAISKVGKNEIKFEYRFKKGAQVPLAESKERIISIIQSTKIEPL